MSQLHSASHMTITLAARSPPRAIDLAVEKTSIPLNHSPAVTLVRPSRGEKMAFGGRVP